MSDAGLSLETATNLTYTAYQPVSRKLNDIVCRLTSLPAALWEILSETDWKAESRVFAR